MKKESAYSIPALKEMFADQRKDRIAEYLTAIRYQEKDADEVAAGFALVQEACGIGQPYEIVQVYCNVIFRGYLRIEDVHILARYPFKFITHLLRQLSGVQNACFQDCIANKEITREPFIKAFKEIFFREGKIIEYFNEIARRTVYSKEQLLLKYIGEIRSLFDTSLPAEETAKIIAQM